MLKIFITKKGKIQVFVSSPDGLEKVLTIKEKGSDDSWVLSTQYDAK